ncbi:MAG: phage major capsid protein [Gammaproteobacteria bacterium]|nr:phage major capsid protein [Gammaproteobacteria bacterium]
MSIRSSEIREKLNELAGEETLTEEQRSEVDTLTEEYRDVETKRRAAIVAEDAEEREAAKADGQVIDAELRERLELRKKATVTAYVQAALRGRRVDGAEHELSVAAGVGGDIPLELWEPDPREVREEERAVTEAPGTVGVNMAPIQPAVFAPSIAASMGIDMPQVASGTFGQARINASLTASAKAKGSDIAATEATFTVATATPKRVSARLELLAEDIASAGVSNFESALRQNLSLVLSAELDNQFINGDGSGANVRGLFAALTNPTADGTTLTFAHGLEKLAALIDGLWAMETAHVRQIVGVDTYRLASKLVTSASTGEVTLAEYLRRVSGGFRTNSRMPATASMKQQALAFRAGRGGMRTAVSPHWGRLAITDVYTGSAKAETAVSFHVLVGDVLVIQPGAYSQIEYKVS